MGVCAQCGGPFEQRSKVHRFCSRACQLDARAGRSSSSSALARETGYRWRPVAPATEHRAERVRPSSVVEPDAEQIIVLPDIHFGFWRVPGSGELCPTHDERALRVAEQIIETVRPNRLVLLGDVLDLPELSKYRLHPEFVGTTQAAIDACYSWLKHIRPYATQVIWLSGNHDERIINAIQDNVRAASALHRPNETDPVLSIPYLLRLEELDIEYKGAYPAGAYYLNDHLACLHGRWLGSRRRSAAAEAIEQERVSVIFGHTHRISMAMATRNTRHAPKFVGAWNIGTLSKIDGSVPSTRGGWRPGHGPVQAWEDWQQGLAYVEVTEDWFSVELIPIFEGRARWGGRTWRS